MITVERSVVFGQQHETATAAATVRNESLLSTTATAVATTTTIVGGRYVVHCDDAGNEHELYYVRNRVVWSCAGVLCREFTSPSHVQQVVWTRFGDASDWRRRDAKRERAGEFECAALTRSKRC